MRMSINGTDVTVEWEDNQAVADLQALVADAPLTVNLSMYGGFEQVGSLGTTLTSDDVQTSTAAGDIVLYSGNKIVQKRAHSHTVARGELWPTIFSARRHT